MKITARYRCCKRLAAKQVLDVNPRSRWRRLYARTVRAWCDFVAWAFDDRKVFEGGAVRKFFDDQELS